VEDHQEEGEGWEMVGGGQAGGGGWGSGARLQPGGWAKGTQGKGREVRNRGRNHLGMG